VYFFLIALIINIFLKMLIDRYILINFNDFCNLLNDQYTVMCDYLVGHLLVAFIFMRNLQTKKKYFKRQNTR
jgi:hypothetical protein